MADLGQLLAIALLFLIGLSWPLLMVFLACAGIHAGWRGRWRRMLGAALLLGAMLVWGVGLPAWQAQRMQAALDIGPYQPGALPDLRGSQVALLGTVDSRHTDSECLSLIRNVGVARVWQAGGDAGATAALPIESELLPPAPGKADCARRPLAAGETAQPDWLLVLPDRHFVPFGDPADWSRLWAHFGASPPAGLRPDYMLVPVGADGVPDPGAAALAGFPGRGDYPALVVQPAAAANDQDALS